MAPELSFDLEPLLRSRTISHPTILTKIEMPGDASMTWYLNSLPWWEEDKKCTDLISAKMVFGDLQYFSAGHDFIDWQGQFENDEALEDFEIIPTISQSWANGSHCQIYTSDPTACAKQIWYETEEVLARIECPIPIDELLNSGSGGIRKFSEILEQGPALLGAGPLELLVPAIEILESSGAACTQIAEPPRHFGRYLVRWNGSRFLCHGAKLHVEQI